jgi:hypothetical protein
MWMRRQTKVVSEFWLWRHPFPTCNKKPGSFRSPGFLIKNKIKRSHPAAALTGIGAGAGTGCEFLFLAVKPLYRQTLRIRRLRQLFTQQRQVMRLFRRLICQFRNTADVSADLVSHWTLLFR